MSNKNSDDQKYSSILIVDDLPANLKLLGEILKAEGYKIRQVSSGELALQVADLEKPVLVLLDIMMPGIDGYEVCRRLKMSPALKEIPVIFISALNEPHDIVKALSAGGVDYITKPFNAEEVKARVSTHIKLYQQSKELQELNATKDKFFSIIAHDLRSPFVGLLGLSQILEDDAKTMTPDAIEEFAGMLNKSAKTLFTLLENLLEWSRMQQGTISYNPEPLSLSSKVNECLTLVKDLARNKGIETISDVAGNVEILADERMFETIIRNLVSNAVKFTPTGGKIIISAKKPAESYDNHVMISVSDNGIGMTRELLSDLFKINVKTGRDGTDGEPSTGLGLMICKDFIEKHGGKIWVESEVEKGSVFSFTIPATGSR